MGLSRSPVKVWSTVGVINVVNLLQFDPTTILPSTGVLFSSEAATMAAGKPGFEQQNMFVNNLRDVIVILSRTTLVGMEDELERINEPIWTDGLILA